MASWQSTFKTILSIMPYLLETGTLSDVTFLVGNGPNKKSFNAHKLLLAVRSDVFERMFFGALPEKEERIEIPDVSPDIFEIMLKFIYNDTLEVKSMEEAIDTFVVADRYNITQLLHFSSNYIKEKLNPKNVCLVYQMSSIYEEKNLNSVCSQIISRNPEEVIQSETFTQISSETLEDILGIISLNISNHLLLFECLIKWAKAEIERHHDDEPAKNLRQLMDPFLPKIKFLSMSSEEFTRGPAASDILTGSEIGKILMNITIPNSAALPVWCNKGNNFKQKIHRSLALPFMRRLVLPWCSVSRQSGFSPNDTYESLSCYEVLCTIEVIGKAILLNGFTISNFSNPSSSVLFKINGCSESVACSYPTTNLGDETQLMLNEPFLLEKDLKYLIQVSGIGTIFYFNDIIRNADVVLPIGGHLRIKYLPIYSSSAIALPFHELYYTEPV